MLYLLRKIFNIFPLYLLIVFLSFPNAALAYHYQNSETGADYILVGVGVLRQNLTSVDGDAISFEDTDGGLPRDYSNRSYLSLYGEGLLNKDWAFTLNSQYDQEDPDQEFRFLLKLKNQENYIILGDHEEGTFLDTIFTASDDKIRGVTLHGEKGITAATAMAGAVRGESVTDEIRGDGTSGRYRLLEAPVIVGSENVRIEVRDRTSPTRVIKSTSQLRGRDYTIDYDRGEILFTQPVDESDFRGNPIFIVASYQFDTPGGLYKRSRYGGRTTVDVTPDVRLGVTYLADSNLEDDSSSNIFSKRQQIIGSDLSVNLNDQHILSIEVAQSSVPMLESETDDTAVRADFLTTVTDDFRIRGNYWRVGKDFLTFGSRDLDSGNVINGVENDSPFFFKSRSLDFDLDPNNSAALGTDMESYGLSASHDLGFHTASAGFRNSRDNIPGDDEDPINHHDTYFATISRSHPDGPDYMVGTEFLFDSGDGEEAVNDSKTSRFISGVRHTFGGADVTGPLTLQAAYQYEQFEDSEENDNSRKVQDLLIRGEIMPLSDFILYTEGGLNYLYEEREEQYTEQALMGLGGFEGKVNRYLQLDGSAKYKIYTDLIDNNRNRQEETYYLRWKSTPLDTLRTSLHLEYRRDEDLIADSTTTKTLVGAAFWWDITAALLLHTYYEKELNNSDSSGLSDDSSGYDDILIRADWQIFEEFSLFAYYRLEYDELTTEPLDATRVRTTTEMFGGRYQFHKDFEFVAAYRHTALNDEANNYKLKTYGELVYSLSENLAIAPGYEHSRYADDDERDGYEANVFYINLIGKL